jgi:outer membrane protein OmpA-like peptidoglycan-associated protein/tetratricopeptide (TPR) repeat protein
MECQQANKTSGRRCFTKGSLLLLLYCLLVNASFGQATYRADDYFEAEQYYQASLLYEEILENDSTNYQAAFRVAHAYRKLFNYRQAARWYAYVARNASANFPLSVYHYASMLKSLQRYEDAIQWYDRFLDLKINASSASYLELARQEKQGCLQALIANDAAQEILPIRRLPEPVNTEFHEFAPVIYQNDSVLAFTSSRLSSDQLISNRSGESFPDQWLMQSRGDSWENISKSQKFDQLNSEGADASGSFTADGKSYYFTHCSENGGNCRIYVSLLKNNKWQKPKALPAEINEPKSNSKHPHISAGGDTLFFVSDRKGGYGKHDIWMSVMSSQGWQQAVNLGGTINTSMEEISPFYVGSEGLLIFASDGHPGMGGMDLYLSALEDSQRQIPTGLVAPFNSSADDCYFVFGDKSGYFCSNREGNFDIYSFGKQPGQSLRMLTQGIQAQPVSQQPQMYGTAFQDIIVDYTSIVERRCDYLTVMRSSQQDFLSNGSSRFVLSADVNDILLEQLRDEQALIRGSDITETNPILDTLSRENVLTTFTTYQIYEDKVEIKGRVEQEGGEPVAALRLSLLDQDGNVIKITTTNQSGEFRFIDLRSAASYDIIHDVGEEGPYRVAYEILGYGDEVRTVQFENIYFDFNQSYLRNEARVALDELRAYYREHPEAVIEINAFTDSTGNDIYNLQLSRDRGLAAFDYLLEAGVDRSSLVINARGASTAISSTNNFVSQQLNRRVEIYISGREVDYQQEVVTRMLRPQVTLYTLANNTGMSIEDIKRLNGISGNEIQAYKPVRLYDWAAARAPALFYQMQVRSEE